MKNLLIISTLAFFCFFGTAQAQDASSQKNNYLILSKNIKQLKPIILTAKDLAMEDGKKFGKFYVIFCGKTVKDIPQNNNFKTLIKEAQKHNVKMYACGLSLKKFNINKEEIPNTIEITKNGILYGFQLTKKGFITLTI